VKNMVDVRFSIPKKILLYEKVKID